MPHRAASFRTGTAIALALTLTGCALLNRQARPEQPAPTPSVEAARPTPAPAVRWQMPEQPGDAEPALRALLMRAKAESLPIAVSDGPDGQAPLPGGIQIDMRAHRAMTLDAKAQLLRVQAGAGWKEVLAYMHHQGFSPMAMPVHAEMTVGGALMANSHGLPPGTNLAGSVSSFRLMLADGRVVRCSRSERSELFKLVLGGWGLFGVILDAELRVVPNERLRLQRSFVRPEAFAAAAEASSRTAGLAFGRFSVAPTSYLREGILTHYVRVPGQAGRAPLAAIAPAAAAKRRYWLAAVGDAGGKLELWEAEKRSGSGLQADYTTRNEILSLLASDPAAEAPAGAFARQTYYMPKSALGAFVERARAILSGNRLELLEVQAVVLQRDAETMMRYADAEVIALSLTHNRAGMAEADIEAVTGELIEAAIALNGRFHVPCGLQATQAQFLKAYPQAPAFFEAKRRYDPEERFQNRLYGAYGR